MRPAPVLLSMVNEGSFIMTGIHQALFAIASLGTMALCISGEPVPEQPAKPFRPYHELPDVLMYEGFEIGTPIWKEGKLETTQVQIPGTHSFKLGEADWGKGDKWLWAGMDLGAYPGKIPGGLDPNNIHIQFMIWADEVGELIIKFKGDGDYEDKPRIARAKTWVPVVLKMSDLIGGGKRPTKDNKFNWVEILFKPRDKNKPYPNVYVDDITFTSVSRPAMVMPQLVAAQMKRGAVERNLEKHGFRYTMTQQDQLKASFKALNRFHKAKTVLIAGARPTDNESLSKGLTAAGTKSKLFGFNYVAAASPENNPVAGLGDMRVFLPSCLDKNDAETVLLVLSTADAGKAGRPSEDVRVVLARLLEEGRLPVVCLAPMLTGISEGEKTKITGFNNTVSNLCIQMNVPIIDASFAIKGITPPFDGEGLSPASLESLANLASQTIKHVDVNLFGRK